MGEGASRAGPACTAERSATHLIVEPHRESHRREVTKVVRLACMGIDVHTRESANAAPQAAAPTPPTERTADKVRGQKLLKISNAGRHELVFHRHDTEDGDVPPAQCLGEVLAHHVHLVGQHLIDNDTA